MAELWFAPKGESVPPHSHDQMDSFVIFLGGRLLWSRGNLTKELGPKQFLHTTRVAAGEAHSFVITGLFGIFINVERWKQKPTSAALDFRLV